MVVLFLGGFEGFGVVVVSCEGGGLVICACDLKWVGVETWNSRMLIVLVMVVLTGMK